jgi:hypothetical protein
MRSQHRWAEKSEEETLAAAAFDAHYLLHFIGDSLFKGDGRLG